MLFVVILFVFVVVCDWLFLCFYDSGLCGWPSQGYQERDGIG